MAWAYAYSITSDQWATPETAVLQNVCGEPTVATRTARGSVDVVARGRSRIVVGRGTKSTSRRSPIASTSFQKFRHHSANTCQAKSWKPFFPGTAPNCPPRLDEASSTLTVNPASSNFRAAVMPAMPAPMMVTSGVLKLRWGSMDRPSPRGPLRRARDGRGIFPQVAMTFPDAEHRGPFGGG